MVRDAYRRYHARWILPAARECGRWEDADRHRQSTGLDFVARLDDGRLLVGEVKWSAARSGPAVHMRLVDTLARLAASGQSWANEVDGAAYVHVSAAGFAPEMASLVASDGRITWRRGG